MTDEPHMQKAQEIVWRHPSPNHFTEDEALKQDIASALAEAYRSGVEAERARCAEIAEGRDRNVMWTPAEIATAIRKA